MSAKVEMLIQVCINGRPLWRKAKTMRGELTYKMTDREYDRVLDATISDLGVQVKQKRARDEEKEKADAAAREKAGAK